MGQANEQLLEEGRTLKDMKIMGKGDSGDSFTKFKGIIVFVKNTELEVGDMVDIKINGVRKNCAFAELIRISRFRG